MKRGYEIMNKTVIIMAGLPGSGKSTEAAKFGGIRICPDSIRGELYGDEGIQGDSKQVFAIAYERFEKALASDEADVVVFDATNITRANRSGIIKIAAAYTDTIKCAWKVTPLEECLKRNAARSRNVPEDVIEKMYAAFEAPSLDEGFSEIIEL